MKNENTTCEQVLAVFQDYLAIDDCVEVIKTTRGYAVIEWDDRQANWEEIEHCPSPAALQEELIKRMEIFLEYGFTSDGRKVTDAEKAHIRKIKSIENLSN